MPEYGLNLWDYWRIIYKRKSIILSIFLVSLFSAHFFGEKTVPIYRATITLHIDSGRKPLAEITGTGVTFWGGGIEQDLPTQLALIKSYSILKDVALKLGYVNQDTSSEKVHAVIESLRGKISTRERENTDLIEISAISTDPVQAKNIVDAVSAVFIEKNWDRKVEEARKTKQFVEEQLENLDRTTTEIKRKLRHMGVQPMSGAGAIPTSDIDARGSLKQFQLKLDNLRERYTDNHPMVINALSKIKNLKKRLKDKPEAEEFEEPRVKVGAVDADTLKYELEVNRNLYSLLKERYERARLMEASETKDITIVNPAVVPKHALGGKKTANVLLGGIIGLVLGLLAAFVIESMDTSIATIEDVEEYLKMPVLGVVPRIDVIKKGEMDYFKELPPLEERKKYEDLMGRIIIQFHPKSSVIESYKNLQTYIKFSGLDTVGNCLMFTSAGIREGKTLTAVNSALCMAQLGYKVVLIDADLRRPSVHKVFGIDREVGLTEAVLGTFKVDDVVKTVDDVMMGNLKSSLIMKTYGMENLHIITSGHLPGNPPEILSSQNMSKFVKEVKSKFQVVFFDSAPILPVTDSCILSSKVDGVILVYEVGRVSRGALRRSKMQLENAKGKPIGVVLNSMKISDMRFGSPFYYYAQKYYGEEPERKAGAPVKKSFFKSILEKWGFGR